jgi:NitT/TauT family transport system substrate-binding protein
LPDRIFTITDKATSTGGRLHRILHQAVAGLCVISLAISAQSRDTLTFMPHWVPQAQFAGYFMAFEKGFYANHGLNVKILTGGPEQIPFDYLQKGDADIVSMWLADGIEKRAHGMPLVLLGQIEQKSALMLVAKKSSGIKTPQDMNGKRVGLWDGQFQLQPQAFFKKYGLHVSVVPQSYSVNLFLRDGVDVASAMWYNEYNTINNAGIDPDELTTFFFFDYGLNFPEAGLFTLESTFANDSQAVSAFVKASLEGWTYAFTHEDETLDVVLVYLQKAHIPASRVHQKWMLQRMNDMIARGKGKVTTAELTPGDFNRVAGALKNSGMIDSVPAFQSFYRWRTK